MHNRSPTLTQLVGDPMALTSFVTTTGTRFSLDGHPWYVNGFNAYFLMAISVDASSRPWASALLEEAASVGLNVCRTWAFNDGNGYHALQTSPGLYDESVFQALDFVVSEANRVGIRLILSLCNNYADFGGKAQYVKWAKDGDPNHPGNNLTSDDDFFSDPIAKGFYKNHVKAVLTRVNSLTGIMYRDDPTIFSWELMNEPRCLTDQSGNLLQAWIEEMAPYVKSMDSNHLLEVGLEGFYGARSAERLDKNPNSYCQLLGTDFIRNHQVAGIDYASMHAYPDAWLGWNVNIEDRVSFLETWIAAHASDCNSESLQMPVLLAEVGLSQWSGGFSVENRDRLLRAAYGAILSSVAEERGAAAGALIWQLFPEQGMEDWSDGYQIRLSRDMSTAAVIIQQCQQIASLNSRSAAAESSQNIPSKL